MKTHKYNEMPCDTAYLKQALSLAYKNVEHGGRPFAAVVVQNNEVIASAVNEMHLSLDPTAHAELLAIRRASQILNTTDLKDCSIYASGQPCPMCLSLIFMTGIHRVVYAYSNEEATDFGLSTTHIYQKMRQPVSTQDTVIEYLPVRLDHQDDLYELWLRG